MKYDEINNPKELFNFMEENIKYGIYGTNHKIYDNFSSSNSSEFQIACQKYYALCDTKRLLKHHYGVCWDQVEFEREWFLKHNFKVKTYFIWFYFDSSTNNYMTHTFLIYKGDNKYYLFEHSDYKNRGIYEFSNIYDAISYAKDYFINDNREYGNKMDDDILNHLEIIEYEKPKSLISSSQFLTLILNSKVIYRNGNYDKSVISFD